MDSKEGVEEFFSPEELAFDQLIKSLVDSRIDQKLTQDQVAEKSGLSRNQVARIETLAVTPSAVTLIKYVTGVNAKISVEYKS